MNGSFSDEALEAYSKLAAAKLPSDFAEGETYDFARCVRADGSHYGTSGTCRKGRETGDKEPEAPKKTSKRAAEGGDSNRDARTDLVKAHSVFKAAKTKEEEARKALQKDKSPEAVQRHREAYQAMSKAEKLYNAAADKNKATPGKAERGEDVEDARGKVKDGVSADVDRIRNRLKELWQEQEKGGMTMDRVNAINMLNERLIQAENKARGN